MPSPPETRTRLLAEALARHEAGEFDLAEAGYRALLAIDPDDADALHLLGALAQQRGDTNTARSLIAQAIAVAPGNALFRYNLALVETAAANSGAAEAAFRAALAIAPDYPEARVGLGNLLRDDGRYDEAGEHYRHGLGQAPQIAGAWRDFGRLLLLQKRTEQAGEVFAQALTLAPDDPDTLGLLAQTAARLGDLAKAEAAYRRMVMLRPDDAAIRNNLGNILQDSGQLDAAIGCYEAAIAADPGFAPPHHNRGTALKRSNRLEEAVAAFRQALARRPDYPEALAGLASALQAQGRVAAAVPLYERALDLDPGLHEALNNLMFALCALPETRGGDLRRITESRVAAWPGAASAAMPARDRTAGRPLRIGYVSPDLRGHPVGYFMAALLPHHDPARVEIFCYADSPVVDPITTSLQNSTPHWRNVSGVSDDTLAAQIRADDIDILVDLSGHMAGHRLRLFARRAAPVQMTWLGYFSTTAVPAMDWIIADDDVIPSGEEHFYTERVIRLPRCYIPFDGAGIPIEPGPLPLLETGTVTFGSMNRRDKITGLTIALWARILLGVPNARLLLKTGSFSDAVTAKEIADAFAGHGIDPARLDILGHSTRAAHLEAYRRIDIALDPFPYSGATTTAESLWMGVPVVTLTGGTFVSRVSASMLRAIGHPELIASGEEDYLRIAIALAADRQRLAGLRATLREGTRVGLGDGPRFARELENVFAAAWAADEGRERLVR
jgi:predicted O-linked N-acetylglucosamine transferase (SPINDLY family)